MSVGVVTGFQHKNREYDVPASKEDRQRFTDELISELEALDGVTNVYNAGTTRSWDSIRLEIELETTKHLGIPRLGPDPRSISPRIRTVFDEFTPASSYDVCSTPTPVNADENIYEDGLYIVEAWFY